MKYVLLLLISIIGTSIQAKTAVDSEESLQALFEQPLEVMKPDALQENTLRLVTSILGRHHYRKFLFNDTFSEQIFDSYFNVLDYSKMFLTQKDIDQFAKYRTTLDDAIARSDVAPAFEIYNLYQERRKAQLVKALKLIDSPFDFTKNEEYRYDRKDASWATNEKELDELWRTRIKNDLLSLKLSGKPLDKARELLKKRYGRTLKILTQMKPIDVFQQYMSSITQTVEYHTDYLSPRNSENFEIHMNLSLQGIGAMLQMDEDFTVVKSLVPGGPADKQGHLQPEDKIIGVGQEGEEIVDVIGWRLDDVVDLIRGPKETNVTLQVLPAKTGVNGKSKLITILRDEVDLKDEAAKSKLITQKIGGKDYKLGVIELPTFYFNADAKYAGKEDYRSTTRDIKRLIGELQQQGIQGLILDLRNNGGGSLYEAINLTGLFIKHGPVVQVKDSSSKVSVESDRDPAIYYNGPLLVMVNRNSASASEIFAAAIQDYGRGLIVGEQTYGKGTVQNWFDLNRLSNSEQPIGHLKFTTAKFYRINGDSTQHKGVVPDIQFPSLFESDEWGESAEKYALPWDKIQSSEYEKADLYTDFVSVLKQKHQKRIAKNPEFGFIAREIQQFREQKELKEISLNEKVRLEKRAEIDALKLEKENYRRGLKGLPPLTALSDNDEEQDETDPHNLQAAEDDKKDEEDEVDPFLDETENILVDLINLVQQRAIAKQP